MDADFPAAHSMDTTWFAVDQQGHVALFHSGEEGPVPEDWDSNCYWVELIGQLRGVLFDSDEYTDEPEPEAVRLGVFIYRHDGYGEPIEPYIRTDTPPSPVHVDQFPPQARKLIKKVCFDRALFPQSEQLQVLEHAKCFAWGVDHAAYLAGDGKTVRPLPGHEDVFAEFVREFRKSCPDAARKLQFEGLQDEPHEPPQRKKSDGAS